MKLDEFLSATNLARYQRMLEESKDEAECEIIGQLLAEELARQESIRRTANRGSTDFPPELEA